MLALASGSDVPPADEQQQRPFGGHGGQSAIGLAVADVAEFQQRGWMSRRRAIRNVDAGVTGACLLDLARDVVLDVPGGHRASPARR